MSSVLQFKQPFFVRVFALLLLVLLSAGAWAQEPGAAAGATGTEEATPAAEPKKVSYSNKWRLRFSGNAESDGVITLKFIPKEGDTVVADTRIKKGTSENSVAKAVVDSLKAQMPKKLYHVERDDGEDVRVKKKYAGKDFGIEIVANTVKNVRISPKKE